MAIQPYSFAQVLSMAAFMRQQGSWVFATETIRPTMPEIFALWPFTEECQHPPSCATPISNINIFVYKKKERMGVEGERRGMKGREEEGKEQDVSLSFPANPLRIGTRDHNSAWSNVSLGPGCPESWSYYHVSNTHELLVSLQPCQDCPTPERRHMHTCCNAEL